MPIAATLLEEALEELLATGRLATIKRWLGLAPTSGGERAVLFLAEAEVALREGRDAEAQVLAEQAAKLSLASELAARSHLVAARAAHMRSNDLGTRLNAERATALTRLPQVRMDARWVEWLNAYETENGRARELWELLCADSDGAPEQTLRLRTAQASIALEVDGDIRESLRCLEATIGLLPHVSNPLPRTSFLHFLSTANAYMCEYERSLEFANRHFEEARSSGLEFATGHALLIRASALIGLRRLGAAKRTLKEVESRSDQASAHVLIGARIRAARLRAAVGDLDRAEILLRSPVPDDLEKASRGELIASRALYLSAMGDLSAARVAAREALATSSFAGTRMISELASAVVSLQESPESPATKLSQETVARAIEVGQLDALVLACRVFPKLARSATFSGALTSELTKILASSNDVDIGRAAGLAMPRELRRTEVLSRREREVYEHLVQGRSNREIAKTLFLSESTIKIHVRHIYEKLKVHTRAEAAAALREDD